MDERPTKRRGPIGWLKSRSRRFWITAAIVFPPLYVAGFGPAIWIDPAPRAWGPPISLIYWPLGRVIEGNERGFIRSPLRRYASLYAKSTHLAFDESGREVIDFVVPLSPIPELGTEYPIWGRAQQVRE